MFYTIVVIGIALIIALVWVFVFWLFRKIPAEWVKIIEEGTDHD